MEKQTNNQEHTKDDSSDVTKVKQNEPASPPETGAQQQATAAQEAEEAEKGHS